MIVNHASLALTDIVKNWENEHKLKLVERILTHLREVS